MMKRRENTDERVNGVLKALFGTFMVISGSRNGWSDKMHFLMKRPRAGLIAQPVDIGCLDM